MPPFTPLKLLNPTISLLRARLRASVYAPACVCISVGVVFFFLHTSLLYGCRRRKTKQRDWFRSFYPAHVYASHSQFSHSQLVSCLGARALRCICLRASVCVCVCVLRVNVSVRPRARACCACVCVRVAGRTYTPHHLLHSNSTLILSFPLLKFTTILNPTSDSTQTPQPHHFDCAARVHVRGYAPVVFVCVYSSDAFFYTPHYCTVAGGGKKSSATGLLSCASHSQLWAHALWVSICARVYVRVSVCISACVPARGGVMCVSVCC